MGIWRHLRRRNTSQGRCKVPKAVINACYGGFSLSRAAFHELRKRGNKVALEEPDYGEMWSDGSGPRESWSDTVGHFCSDIPRDDPDLIAVVEQMGDAANGNCARLRIVDVPDGVEWEIGEYDG